MPMHLRRPPVTLTPTLGSLRRQLVRELGVEVTATQDKVLVIRNPKKPNSSCISVFHVKPGYVSVADPHGDISCEQISAPGLINMLQQYVWK
jgi:hypothetical protein